jgi:hypothetical protein
MPAEYRPRHASDGVDTDVNARPSDKPAGDNRAHRIAGELALSLRGRSLDVIAAELRRRLTAAGLRPIGDDFLQLFNAISDGSAAKF